MLGAIQAKTEDSLAQISLTAIDGTVWLTQDEIGVLFDKGRSTVAEHIQNIFSESELDEDSVCRNFRRTTKDGKDYSVLHYNLDMILAVGFRVRSPRGTQFRRWANTILKEYLVKGFAMDDERQNGVNRAFFGNPVYYWKEVWCPRQELNPRPTAYKAVALPTELQGLAKPEIRTPLIQSALFAIRLVHRLV